MEETKTPAKRTPSEVLMEVLEDFGGDEPAEVIVVWTTKAGDLAWAASSLLGSQNIGLLEVAKHLLIKQAVAD